MLRIDGRQLARFSDVARSDFEARMLVHLRGTFAELCRPLADAELRATIRRGVERAATYGLVQEYDVCRFLHLVVVLGRDFDVDPAHRYVHRRLTEPGAPPSLRIQSAYDAAIAAQPRED